MALTKVNWYFSTILIVGLLFSSLLLFGNDIANKPDNNLDNDSYEYIDQYAMYLDDSGFDDLAEVDVQDLKEEDILTSNETGASSITDFLANLNFFNSKIRKISNTLQLVYNIPTLIISTTGLPAGEFRHVLNIIGWVLFASMVILLVRLVRGS